VGGGLFGEGSCRGLQSECMGLQPVVHGVAAWLMRTAARGCLAARSVRLWVSWPSICGTRRGVGRTLVCVCVWWWRWWRGEAKVAGRRALRTPHPAPRTLHPAPCTLHCTAHCALHPARPAPCTLHTLHSLHPAPCTGEVPAGVVRRPWRRRGGSGRQSSRRRAASAWACAWASPWAAAVGSWAACAPG